MDYKGLSLRMIGAFQLLAIALLIFVVVNVYPPDLEVWWNVPVPKGGRVGIGAYLLLLLATSLFAWQTVSLIRLKSWAIVVGAPFYLGIGIQSIYKQVSFLASTSVEWNERSIVNALVSFHTSFMFLFACIVAIGELRLMFSNRKASQRPANA